MEESNLILKICNQSVDLLHHNLYYIQHALHVGIINLRARRRSRRARSKLKTYLFLALRLGVV